MTRVLLLHYLVLLLLASNNSIVILAWQIGPFLSSRNPRASKAQNFLTATGGLSSVVPIFVPSVWASQQELTDNTMVVNHNAAVVATAVGITSLAVVSSIVSWRRMQDAQQELALWKEGKATIESSTRQQTKQNANKRRAASRSASHQNPDNQRDQPSSGKTGTTKVESNDLSVMRIGVVRSIYRLCVGTPRQGLLAPDARGRIELDKIGNTSTAATVSGLEDFSYIWVVFHFHLNTQPSKKERRFKSKIAPPALGGKKVGIYATRSPHRHNPIGITLCKLDRIQVHGPHQVTLHVSGLDLVDGTPVLDVKPYVPVYDSVNAFAEATSSAIEKEPSTKLPGACPLPPPRVPEWVEGGLATKRNVVITEAAKAELETILETNPSALEFYGPHCYRDALHDGTKESTVEIMLRVIEQILSIDVRSSHQTRKARKGRSQAERARRVSTTFDVESGSSSHDTRRKVTDSEGDNSTNPLCTQQIDNLLVSFRVTQMEAKRDSSRGSGAEDGISIESIQLLSSLEKAK